MNETIIAPDEPKKIVDREIEERKSVIEKAVEQFDLKYQKWKETDERSKNSFIQFPIETSYSASGRFLNNDIAKAISKLEWVEEKHLTVETKYSNKTLTVRVNL